jgi:DNA topoisomerase-2
MTEVFRRLSDVEHCLERPGMYIGSTGITPRRLFIDGKPETADVCPGLMKIIGELVDNAVDEHLRSNGKYATRIEVECGADYVRVTDNGRGIPVKDFDGLPQPVVAWTSLRAGTSFNDIQTGPSCHGVGASVTNIFSRKFSAETSDGKNTLTLTCSDNMSSVDYSVRKSKNKGTVVYCEPDFTRFEQKSLTLSHRILRERLIQLSVAFPKIEFFWNESKVSLSREEFVKKFSDCSLSWKENSGFCAVFLHDRDEFVHFSSVNGLELPNGGSHVDVISSELFKELSLSLKRKAKTEIPVSEIKRSLGLIAVITGFENPSFNSQTKEQLVNSNSDVKRQLSTDWKKQAKRIAEEDCLSSALIESFLARQEAKGLRAANKKKPKCKKIEKHVPARSLVPEEKTLFLTEGDSAVGGSIAVRDTLRHGFFPLRGIPLSIWGLKIGRIFENKEFESIKAILNLRLEPLMTDGEKVWKEGDIVKDRKSSGEPLQYCFDSLVSYHGSLASGEVKSRYRPETYGRIALMSDQDVDGCGAVRPLLLQFLFLWPELFAQGRVAIVNSPLIILTKGKEREYFFSKKEYEGFIAKNPSKGWETRYIKGLGSLREAETEDMLNDSCRRWTTVEIDDPECFQVMYSDDVSGRRSLMEG